MELKLQKVYKTINDPKCRSGQIDIKDIFILQSQNERDIDQYIFWTIIDATGKPFNRRFFDYGQSNKGRGALRFDDHDLTIIETLKGEQAI